MKTFMKRLLAFCLVAFICFALLTGCANHDIELISTDELPPMTIMVNNKLYYHTGQHIEFARCGVMDGKITDFVPVTELPEENYQSNFGDGYEYQLVDENHIDVVMEDGWIRFCTGECKDDHSQTLTEDLYTQQAGDFVPDYDTEVYDSIPVNVTYRSRPMMVIHTTECPEGGCITEDGDYCYRTDTTICICSYVCGYPTKEKTVTVVGNIQAVE